MGSFGYILGGAMQGIGGALATQAQEQSRSRHETALENLRQQNQREMVQVQGDMQDRNGERSDNRANDNAARQVQRTTNATVLIDGNRSNLNINEGHHDTQNRITLARISNAHDADMVALRSALSRGDDEYARSLEAGDVTETLEGSDGFYYFRRRDGSTVRSTVGIAPRASAGGSTVIADARGIGAGRPTPAPAAARPAAPPRAAAPATAPVRERYAAPNFRQPSPAAAQPQPRRLRFNPATGDFQ